MRKELKVIPRPNRKNSSYRVFSSNFPTQIMEFKEKKFVPESDYSVLLNKYNKLVERQLKRMRNKTKV